MAQNIQIQELSDIEKRIIGFAEQHRQIIEVTRGNCPEQGVRAYYLLVREYALDLGDEITNLDLGDEITNLDLELDSPARPYFDIFQFPRPENPQDRWPFLGETIYKKSQFKNI